MPINSAQKLGSSQQRGGHTQQEQTEGRQPLVQSYHADPTAEALSAEVRQPVKKQLKLTSHANQTAKALNVLEEVMSSVDPNLAECEIIRIISEYDVKVPRELISTLRSKIKSLKVRISSGKETLLTRRFL